MRTHQELVEEVYHNPGFRSEFKSYAQLRLRLQAEQQTHPKAPAAPNPKGVSIISYADLLAKPSVAADSPLVQKCKRGIAFLYSSLARALSKAYQLDAEETRRLIFAVADRHAQYLSS